MEQERCINIDWLEMYVLEPPLPRDIQYFEARGYLCIDRGYGTKHMAEVFTVCDKNNDPMIEVRRNPRRPEGEHHTVYPDNAATLRFVNRYCYFQNAARIMSEFIDLHEYEPRRIYRLDICLDFTKFDSGDIPSKVMRRILRHQYVKVYQSLRCIHGEDRWTGAIDNSITWGKPSSMILTRFYNKTLELEQKGDKPWIKQAWFEAGLVNDPITCTVKGKDGRLYKPEVWRLEFRINSKARRWVVLDTDEGKHYLEHRLSLYEDYNGLLTAFAELTRHYFSFRIYREGVCKYDCKEKVLFKFDYTDVRYSLQNTATDREYKAHTPQAIKQLEKMRQGLLDKELLSAIDLLIHHFRTVALRDYEYQGISPKLLQLQMALSDKKHHPSVKEVQALFPEIW